GRKGSFPPGKYAAALLSCGLVGYQYLYPLQWFETYRTKDKKRSDSDEGGLRVRAIPAPQPPEDYWPNERLLKFRDFHIFPHFNPHEFFKVNRRVSPGVILSVENSGVIQRQKLAAPLEALLCWRIYRNGRLINKGSAGGNVRHPVQETGTYVAYVGVEGPTGFMPVSNCLEFPLFPTKSGGVELFPTATNPDHVPDYLLDVLPPEALSEVLSQDWAKGGGGEYYNRQMVYALNAGYRLKDKKKQALLSLWTQWSWELWSMKGNPNSELGRINLGPAVAKPASQAGSKPDP
ncbi:MAG: hypothetical protein ACREKL_09520, partial [Chthoniobacterales bacterium]